MTGVLWGPADGLPFLCLHPARPRGLGLRYPSARTTWPTSILDAATKHDATFLYVTPIRHVRMLTGEPSQRVTSFETWEISVTGLPGGRGRAPRS